MKRVMAIMICTVLLLGSITLAFAKTVRVKGYHRRDGTYVQPHYRTTPDRSRYNNWSTKGNVNPYTGKRGYSDPYRQRKPVNLNPYGYRLKQPGLQINK